MEKAIRKKRLTRAGFILNTFLFGLGGYVFFTQEKWLFGGVLIFVALANLYALQLGENKVTYITIGLNLLNAIVAGITAYDYYIQGTKGLHLMWVLIAILYSIVTLVFFIKNRRIRNENT